MGSKLIRRMFNLLIKKIVMEYLDGCHVIIWLSCTQPVSLFMCNIHSSISNFLIVLVIAIEMTNHYSQMHDSEEAFWV